MSTQATIECPPVISDQTDQYARCSRNDAKTDRRNILPSRYHQPTQATPVDPVEKVNGMYRLLDVVGESGSNGYGRRHLPTLNLLAQLANYS